MKAPARIASIPVVRFVNRHRLFEAVLQTLQRTKGELSQAAAAEMACLSRGAFSREFHRIVGCCFRDAKLACKLKDAPALIGTNNLSIQEVSERLGYSEPRKFRQSFKKVYGMPPSMFRHRKRK